MFLWRSHHIILFKQMLAVVNLFNEHFTDNNSIRYRQMHYNSTSKTSPFIFAYDAFEWIKKKSHFYN